MCSLHWQHSKLALEELERACDELGAVGVMVLANIGAASLADRIFSPIWREIDRRGLPGLPHPTAPTGTKELEFATYNLIAPAAFMFDTPPAGSPLIFDGSFER